MLDLQASRRDRNVRLVARLQELGFDITLEEAEARGRGMTGRPHFAQIMVEKGYVANLRQAFDDYLDESAKGYVYRREPQFAEGVERIRARRRHRLAGASGAREGRRPGADAGTVRCRPERDRGISQRSHRRRTRSSIWASPGSMACSVTGGSDYHGTVKPNVTLGTGYNGNLHIPADLLDS